MADARQQQFAALRARYGIGFNRIRSKGQILGQEMGVDIDLLPLQDQFRLYDRVLQEEADMRNTRPVGR